VRETLGERVRASWRGPRSFTSVVPLPGADWQKLRSTLEAERDRYEERVKGIEDLHSFRLCAVPADERFSRPVSLLFNAVHDRPPGEAVKDLVDRTGAALAGDLSRAGHRVEAPALEGLLHRHRVREQTLHLGAIGKKLPDIRREQELRQRIERFVDERLAAKAWTESTPAETTRLEIRAHLLSLGRADVLREACPPLPLHARAARLVDLVLAFMFPGLGLLAPDMVEAVGRIRHPIMRGAAWLGLAVWSVFGAITTGLSLLFIRFLEKVEPDRHAPPPDADKVLRLEQREDLLPKNEVTLWLPVRPTLVRRIVLFAVLFGAERGCRHFWTDGRLVDIETIHYARIMQVDGGRTMLFMSDYDGGLNRYLDDFLGAGRRAVLPISSSFDGCAKTRWLFEQEDPSDFDPRWRGVIRTYQLETSVWYSAHPLTVREILNNAAIRDGVFAPRLSEDEARRWARRL
jgi:hypothetical protein